MRFVRVAAVDEREHGAAQGLGAADAPITAHLAHRSGDEFHRGVGVDCPM